MGKLLPWTEKKEEFLFDFMNFEYRRAEVREKVEQLKKEHPEKFPPEKKS